jgi:hypothetical protein
MDRPNRHNTAELSLVVWAALLLVAVLTFPR